MKLLVLGLTLLFVCYSHQDDDKDFKEIQDKCIKESGVDASVLGKDMEVAKYKDNQPFKCYLKCVLVGFGAMTEAGELVEEEYKKQHLDFSADDWAKLVEKCKTVKGKDACETAFLLGVCVEDNAKNF